MTKSEFKELGNLALKRQRYYMELTGQIDKNGKMLVNVNYVELLKEEYNEFMKARDVNDRIEMVDALCDIIVCQAGVNIQRNCTYFIDEEKILGYISSHDREFDFVGGLNEVFDNNLARLQYDENGNVILDMREFLEDGTKNPKFGKVKKKDITPNLQQFFRN